MSDRKPSRCYICGESDGKLTSNQQRGFGRHNWMHPACMVRAKQVVDDLTNTGFEKLIFRASYRKPPKKNI